MSDEEDLARYRYLQLKKKRFLSQEGKLSDVVSKQPETLAGKSLGLLKEFTPAPTESLQKTPIFSGQQQDVVTSPLKPLLAVEKYAQPIAEAGREPFERGIESISSKISEAGYPKTGKAVGMAGEFALPLAMPFSPTEFGNTGALAMGMSVPKVGKGIPITDEMREIGGVTPPMVGGKFISYMRKVFGEDISDTFTNHFINTQRPLAETLVRQGKPSLGTQVAEKAPEILSMKSKQQAYNFAGKELTGLEKQIQDRLNYIENEMKKPIRTQGAEEATKGLEYKPTTYAPVNETPPLSVVENPVGTGLKPERVILGDVVKTQQPGGATYQTITPGKGIPVDFTGQTQKSLPAGSASLQAEKELFLRGQEIQGQRAGNLKTNRPGTIDLNEIAGAVDEVADQYTTGTRQGKISKINRLKENFIRENPKVLTEKGAMELKRKLDNSVGKAYLASPESTLTPEIETEEALANALRKKLYELDPELGRLSDMESLMIRVKTGLEKSIAKSKSGGAIIPLGWFSGIANRLIGSRYAAGAGLALNKMFGSPSTVAVPLVRAGIGQKLKELSKENQKIPIK